MTFKTGWERRQAYIPVDVATAGRMLAPARLGVRPRALERIGRGLVNSNYRVRMDDGEDVLLRVYARDPAACGRERAVAERLAGLVPVPAVLHADASGTAFPLPYAVCCWVDGTLADDVVAGGSPADRAAVAAACGAVLAAIQGVRFAAPGFLDGDLRPSGEPLTPGAYRTLMRALLAGGPAGVALGPDLAGAALRHAEAHAPLLESVAGDASLVHCDFNGANILLRARPAGWEVAAILDWEFSLSGTTVWDVANMLRHHAAAGPDFERPFIAAFSASGGALPPDWRRTARTLDLLALCAMLETPDPGPAMVAAIAGMVRRYLGA